MNNQRSKIILACLLIFSLIIRLYGLNWDQNQHLHPDERFLTMVAVAQKIPTSIAQYFNPQTSGLNPANVGFKFYVYGTFPITLTKYIATRFDKDDYVNLTLVGRGISAVFDTGIVLLVYAIVRLFEKRYKWDWRVKHTAALLYSIMVLPIQHAHFFTVDSFVTFFMLGSFYFALAYYFSSRLILPILSGIFLGLALASKINAIYIAPLNFAVMFLPLIPYLKKYKGTLFTKHVKLVLSQLLAGIAVLFSTYFTLRLADPYLFATSNVFDISINPTFINNIHQLRALSNATVWFPPGVQWLTKTKIIFPLQNIVFFGMGPTLFLCCVYGIFKTIQAHRSTELLTVYFWIVVFFIYQGMQFTMNMRYFYILYPLLAIPAGYTIISILKKNRIALCIILISISIWPLMFLSIYSHPHSRVTASEWIYANIPEGSRLAQEHWDDSIPLPLDGIVKQYEVKQLPVFGQDDAVKWQEMNTILHETDYIIFTSNRGYGSIMTAPLRYPLMSAWYTDLFAGKMPFKKIKEFTSYPGIEINLTSIGGPTKFRFEIPDQWSDESFTVYDHPVVTIFKRT